jgi:protein-tyrosine phosphatase
MAGRIRVLPSKRDILKKDTMLLKSRSARIVSLTGGAAILAAVCYVGVCAARHENTFLNLEAVAPGVLLRSAQPGRGDIERLEPEYGVKTILSLRDWEDPEVLAYAKAHGIDWIVLKMHADMPPTPEQQELFLTLAEGRTVDLDRFQSVIRKGSRTSGQVKFGRPVLMHCQGGADRSGVMTALFRIEEQGFSVEEAKADMLRHFHLWFIHPAQYRFLDQYHPRRLDLPPS